MKELLYKTQQVISQTDLMRLHVHVIFNLLLGVRQNGLKFHGSGVMYTYI